MLLKRINQCICFSCSRQGSLWHIIYALSVMVAKLHKGIQGVEEHVKDMAHESVCKVLEQQWSSLDAFLFFQWGGGHVTYQACWWCHGKGGGVLGFNVTLFFHELFTSF